MNKPDRTTADDRAVTENHETAPATSGGTALLRIGAALNGLRYGSVLAIVQDGVVIQIERTEKTRLEKPSATRKRGI
jgi:hypothetical protein